MTHQKSSTFMTIEPGVSYRHWLHELRVHETNITPDLMQSYLIYLATKLDLEPHKNKPQAFIERQDAKRIEDNSLRGILLAQKGQINACFWQAPRLLTLYIQTYTQRALSTDVIEITKNFFGLIESTELSLIPDNIKKQSNKIEVRSDHPLGHGVFAKEDISKGEFLGGLYGPFHEAESAMCLPDEYRDHAMQCAEHLWRNNKSSQEAPQYLNHSCNPNCGVQGLFDFYALKDIKAGEEITTDYAMQDDSDWEVPGGICCCGSNNCRKKILPYRQLPTDEKKKYSNATSHWLLHKYKQCTCKQEQK